MGNAVHLWLEFWRDFTALFDWKALGAIATFSAVLVALRRDHGAERDRRIREASAVYAIIDQVTSTVRVLKAYQENRTNKRHLSRIVGLIEESNIVEMTSGVLSSYKFSDLPTIESMTTVSVLVSRYRSLTKKMSLALNNEVQDFGPDIETLDECLADLEHERAAVAGPDTHRATIEGHRRWRNRKLGLDARAQAAKALPKLIRTILFGAPKN